MFPRSPSDHAHKGRRSSCCTLVSAAVGTPGTNTCCRVRALSSVSQWLLPKHTQTHATRRAFVLAGSHTPHYQLRRYVTVHCEDWGKVPRPPILPYDRLIGWHLDQLSAKTKWTTCKLCVCYKNKHANQCIMFLLSSSNVITYLPTDISEFFVISVTGAVVMQQLKQQRSHLTKVTLTIQTPPCFLKLLSRNTGSSLSFFLLCIFL